ncbi:nitroreductase/quinone reductase family protein [Nocardia sp. NPDC058480]|uniref:nitroreductase/quinone reductase family protein n=1 Tax=unclassified Nocardia TaxID=2637762 RepID=UPI003647850C
MSGTSMRFARMTSYAMDAIVGKQFRSRGGRLRVGQVGILELATIGRRSGRARSVILSHYSRTEDGYVVIGTNAGSRHQPGWYYNISADPRVAVTADGLTQTMLARIVTGTERRRLLRLFVLRGYGIPALLVAALLIGTRTVPIVVLHRTR